MLVKIQIIMKANLGKIILLKKYICSKNILNIKNKLYNDTINYNINSIKIFIILFIIFFFMHINFTTLIKNMKTLIIILIVLQLI